MMDKVEYLEKRLALAEALLEKLTYVIGKYSPPDAQISCGINIKTWKQELQTLNYEAGKQ